MIIQWTKGTYKEGSGFLGNGFVTESLNATAAITIAVIVTVVTLHLLARNLALTLKERQPSYKAASFPYYFPIYLASPPSIHLTVQDRSLALSLKDWQEIQITDTGFPYTFPFYFAEPPAKILNLQDRPLQLNVKDRDG